MINIFSIRFRIAAWYFCSAAPILVVLAVGSWFAMRASMYQGIDEELFRRTLGVEQFFKTRGDNAIPELQRELTNGPELPLGGGLFQVFDGEGRLLFESPAIARHAASSPARQSPGEKPIYRNSAPSGPRVRLGARCTTINGKVLTIQVAEPLRSFDESLTDFAHLLYAAIPILLLAIAAAGFWLSGRAMAPVEQINREARAIGANNLTARLSVPKPRDELRTLSETLNAMLERIESSVNRLTQFTADASHELRSPLTLIQTAAEYTLRRERSREELEQAMRKILRETIRTAALIDRLLALARADSDNNRLASRPVDLDALLSDIADSTMPITRKKQIKFSARLGNSSVQVSGDDSALRELFLILIDNAVKYTPAKGSILLRLSTDLKDAVVEIADTGVGIAEEDIPHIFDRFWRADKVRSREMGGTGLGLSIAKWIVNQSGGVITVASELGAGSNFSVRLPLMREASQQSE
jgi:signal transduction histidine kinase